MIKIVNYTSDYQKAFKSINEEWIKQYFVMEEADHKALDHPEEYILNKGGAILVALDKEEPIGVCALIKMNHPKYDFELAKMGVVSKAHGKGTGFLLGKKILEKANNLGGKYIFLETNTRLTPAISLYAKLGFKEVKLEKTSPYERSNYCMEVEL